MKLSMKSILPLSLLMAVLAWAPDGSAQLRKLYDPQKVVTIQGKIERLETITRQGRQAKNGRTTQIAYLQTDQGTMVVHLGPTEFLARQQFSPRAGDRLEVTGGRVHTRQGDGLLANTVKSGGRTLHLRDANGVAVWSGQTPGCYGSAKTPPRS